MRSAMFQVGDSGDRVDPVGASQAALHGCVKALATPGLVVRLASRLTPASPLQPAAATLLLALLDQDTRLWLSPGAAAGNTPASLKFHTGCSLAAAPAEAEFALVAAVKELPPLDEFNTGSGNCPERSATVILQVPELVESGWNLSGPGISGKRSMAVPALGPDFLAQWDRNRARFPRGVDLYLVCGERLCGLPRTTRIEI